MRSCVAFVLVLVVACGGGSPPASTPASVTPSAGPTSSSVDAPTPSSIGPSTTATGTSGAPTATTSPASTSSTSLPPASWVDLGTLPGGEVSAATDINNHGVIVGHSYVGEFEDYAVWWPDRFSQPRRLDELVPLPSGSPLLWATKVNDAGQVLAIAEDGTYVIDVPTGNATRIVPSFGEIGVAGVAFSAEDINERGQVVGTVTIGWPPENPTVTGPMPITRAFLWEYDTGDMIDLGTLPGTESSSANAINDNGMIVGSCDGRPVVWDDAGALRELDLRPGDTSAYPLDINNVGGVVGFGGPWDANTGEVRLDWPNGTEINNVGQVADTQLGINDLGETVGQTGLRATYWPAGWLAADWPAAD